MQDAAAVSKHVERLLQSVGKVCCQPMCSLNKYLGNKNLAFKFRA